MGHTASAGDKLLIYCIAPKVSEAAFKFSFQAKRWYHLAITHSNGGPLTPSTVRLYINGEQQSGIRFRFPKVSAASGHVYHHSGYVDEDALNRGRLLLGCQSGAMRCSEQLAAGDVGNETCLSAFNNAVLRRLHCTMLLTLQHAESACDLLERSNQVVNMTGLQGKAPACV